MDFTQTEEGRFGLFPIVHKDLWQMYKNAEACWWTAEEVDLSRDPTDFEKMTRDEQHFIKTVLAFFAASDGIVMENLVSNFTKDVKIEEARAFYTLQGQMEAIHSEVYSQLIENIVRDNEEKNHLFNAIESVPSIHKKAEWAKKWMAPDVDIGSRIVAFAVVEGIFFSGAFASIFWLKKRGLMPGLCFSNELISRDEGLHTNFACLLFSKVKNKPSVHEIVEIVSSAVEIEKEFWKEAAPVSMIGMNYGQMAQYVEMVADRLITELGCNKIYFASNPWDWMLGISLSGKTNFFEKRVGEYRKSHIGGTIQDEVFTLDEDF